MLSANQTGGPRGARLFNWARLSPRKMALARKLAIAALVMGATAADVAAVPGSAAVNTSYGYAVFGDLKYGPGFTHFDYVDPDAPKGGEFRVAQPLTFDSLNQVAILGTTPPLLTFNADSLLKQSRDEPASYYCLVCKTISWPQDLSWAEFELRPEARFADGSPMGVDDILYTLSLGKGLATPAYTRVPEMIEKAEKTGPHRLRVTFKMKDNPTLPTVIGLMPIIPEHFYETRDPFKASLEIPIGNGPYEVSGMLPGRYLIMERVKDYWARDLPVNKGRYNFDRIRHDFYRDTSLMNEAFSAGLNDLRLENNATSLRQMDGLQAYQSGDIQRDTLPYENGALSNSIILNARRPFLSNRLVRKAFVLAYDFEWMKRVILGGNYGRVASNFANMEFEASGLPGQGELRFLEKYRDTLPPEVFTQELSLPVGGDRAKARANLIEARELLREAGYHVRNGRLVDNATHTPVTLELLSYSPLMMPQAAPLIASMKRLGVEVKFQSLDAAQLRHKSRNYDYDMLITRAVFVSLPTPGAGLRQLWTSQAANTPNLFNYSGIAMPVIDDAIEAMVNATDRATVVDSLRAVDRVARWNYFTIPLNHSYPTPVGELPISYWNKFGRPDKEFTYNFGAYMGDTWWYDPEKAAKLSHGVYSK